MFAEVPSNDKLHLFLPGVAQTHGLAAALVYQYLAWNCRNFGKWTGTKERLLEIFPYLTAQKLRLVLRRLLGTEEGCAALMSRQAETTYLLVNRVRGGGHHGLDPKMAEAHGLLPAVLYDNVAFWIIKKDTEGDQDPCFYTTPAEWLAIHPYSSLRSVERAFEVLRLAGELVPAGRLGRMPGWSLPLGTGCLDRWKQLHSKVKLVNKSNKSVFIYVPVLNDPDGS